jgi:hypothetical protein
VLGTVAPSKGNPLTITASETLSNSQQLGDMVSYQGSKRFQALLQTTECFLNVKRDAESHAVRLQSTLL